LDFPDALKSQVTVPNLVCLLCIISLVLYKLKRIKASIIVIITASLFVILASTYFLPHYFIKRMEGQFQPFKKLPHGFRDGKVFIHVLGGGYSLSKGAPANVQLGSPTLVRLIEGIRIHRLLANSILVTSGCSSVGFESQASVVRRAAIMLGVDSTKIEMLETPSNTWEEAEALKEKIGSNQNVIVVSDAVHLPRATAFFRTQGFHVVGAPASFLIPDNTQEKPLKWLPSIRNIELSNIILREHLGAAKGFLLN
jgi:uncharacterized SAM-binding protein YcdF (DUF218 family)